MRSRTRSRTARSSADICASCSRCRRFHSGSSASAARAIARPRGSDLASVARARAGIAPTRDARAIASAMDECVRARQSDVSLRRRYPHTRARCEARSRRRARRAARDATPRRSVDAGARRARARTTRGDATTTTTTTTTTRRRALVALVALANARRANAGPATRPFVVDAVKNERWVAVDATFEVPATWANRPGQRARVDKYVLYTDTYGPNYRYTTTVPKLLGDGEAKIDQLALVVVSREGLESVGDLGTIEKIDPARAFGVEGFEGLAASEVAKASVREDAGKQTYYQWELCRWPTSIFDVGVRVGRGVVLLGRSNRRRAVRRRRGDVQGGFGLGEHPARGRIA